MPILLEPIQLLVECSRYRGTETFRKSDSCRCGDTSEITKFRSYLPYTDKRVQRLKRQKIQD